MVGSFVTKSGESALLRYPTLNDVEIATNYINTLSLEDTYITFSGEQLTSEEERKYLHDSLEKVERSDMIKLYCFIGENLVAEGSVERDFRTRKRGVHRAMLGITVKKEYREQGIGKKLMKALISETRRKMDGVKIIILTVFGPNVNAINMYRTLGFKEYGRLPDGLFYNNDYLDYVYMYLNLEKLQSTTLRQDRRVCECLEKSQVHFFRFHTL